MKAFVKNKHGLLKVPSVLNSRHLQVLYIFSAGFCKIPIYLPGNLFIESYLTLTDLFWGSWYIPNPTNTDFDLLHLENE